MHQFFMLTLFVNNHVDHEVEKDGNVESGNKVEAELLSHSMKVTWNHHSVVFVESPTELQSKSMFET